MNNVSVRVCLRLLKPTVLLWFLFRFNQYISPIHATETSLDNERPVAQFWGDGELNDFEDLEHAHSSLSDTESYLEDRVADVKETTTFDTLLRLSSKNSCFRETVQHNCIFDESCLCTELDGNRGKKWRSMLLKNISQVRQVYPGAMTVFGENSEAILASTKNVVVIGAATANMGRILSFTKEDLPQHFLKWVKRFDSVDVDNQHFWNNVLSWFEDETGSSRPTANQVLDISRLQHLDDKVLENKTVLVWQGQRVKDEEFLKRVTSFLEDGGLVICGANPWHWSYSHPMEDLPLNKLLKRYGMFYHGWTAVSERSLSVKDNTASRLHTNQLLNSVIVKPSKTGVGSLRDILKYASMFDSKSQKCLSQGIHNAVRNLRKNCSWAAPTPTHQVSSYDDQIGNLLELFDYQSHDNAGGEVPGQAGFPGTYKLTEKNVLRAQTRLMVQSAFKGHYSTGLYAPPGEWIEFNVTSKLQKNERWDLWIGAHSDDFTTIRNRWKRWPHLLEKTSITAAKACGRLRNVFGGLIYVVSQSHGRQVLNISISRAVDSPQLDIHKFQNPVAWQKALDSAVPWTDLVGNHIMITMPTRLVRKITDPFGLIKHYDRLLEEYHYLRGTKAWEMRRQWIVYDVLPSYGWAHAGYPIVAMTVKSRMDRPPTKAEIDTENNLRQRGSWGLYHELGHNMQVNSWTLKGEGEVTNNIFVLYAFDSLHKVKGRKDHDTEKYGLSFIKSNCTTKKNAWSSLAVHTQIIKAFGWESYRRVYRNYDKRPLNTKDEQKKLDEWIERFSRIVGYSIQPHYELWCFKPSPNLREKLKDLVPLLPDNAFTKSVPKRVEEVLVNYPNATRIAKRIPDMEHSRDMGKPMFSPPLVRRI